MTSPDMPCRDCGRETCPEEYYMVEREVWREAGMGREGYLCIGCLESRLGRMLWASDFTGAPINGMDWECRSARLRDRLSRRPVFEMARRRRVNPDQGQLWEAER